MKDNVADLQEKIDAAEATHNGTRDGLLKSMEELEAKLTAQDAVEKNVEATTDTSIDEFKTDLNGLDAFKADSEKSAAELVKKLSVSSHSCLFASIVLNDVFRQRVQALWCDMLHVLSSLAHWMEILTRFS